MGIASDGERLGKGAYLSVESDQELESPHGMRKNLQEALVMLRAENACGESDTFVETQDAVKKKPVKDKHPDVIPISMPTAGYNAPASALVCTDGTPR